MSKSIKKINCPECGHSDTRISTKYNEFVCNYCGHKWKKGILHCPDCGSRWIRTNANRGDHICRKCGKVWIPTKFKMFLEV